MSFEASPQTWMCRAAAFELLSLVFLPPSREAARALTAGEFSDACGEALSGMGCAPGAVGEVVDGLAPCAGGDAEETYHAIRREHTRLFVGEREPLVTPFLGVWDAQRRGQRGLLFVGEKSMETERFMRRCGVGKDLAAGQANDPVDHVGTLCEFGKFLCLVNARAVQPAEGACIEPGDFERFFSGFFEPYARWCAERVRALSACPFYRAMARMLDCVCDGVFGEAAREVQAAGA